MSKKLISLIVPAYNEEDCVDELFSRLDAVFATEPQYDFEVVIVENGSIDSTWVKLQAIAEKDSRFKILKLSRNFRMDGGLTAGLDFIKNYIEFLKSKNSRGSISKEGPSLLVPLDRCNNWCQKLSCWYLNPIFNFSSIPFWVKNVAIFLLNLI
jgi:glycosyltransferase involved in cell wall biosynthesis